MKISGHRADGAVYLSIGAGMAVILRDGRMSPPTDHTVIEGMGPWAPDGNSLEARRAAAKALDYARVSPVESFLLKDKPKEEVLNLKPDEESPADEAAESPADEAAEAAEDTTVLVPGKKKAVKKVAVVDNPTKFKALLSSTVTAKHLAQKDEHPFTYCMEHIVPKMADEGKAPDDPEAFCAWWKAENG